MILNFLKKFEKNKYMSFLIEVIQRYIQHDIGQTGGQLAYFSLLSLFPFIIYINTLIGALNISSNEIIGFLTPVFPKEIVSFISSYFESISGGHIVGLLSIGIVATVYAASRSVRSMEQAVNKAYNIEEKRGFFTRTAISMLFIICTGIGVLLVIIVTTVSKNLVQYILHMFNVPRFFIEIAPLLKWIVFIVVMFVTISTSYFIMPNKRIKYKSVIPGTIITITGLSLFSMGFTFYVTYIARYSIIYGSIGAVFLLMLWLYIAGIILVLGAEVNSILDANH